MAKAKQVIITMKEGADSADFAATMIADGEQIDALSTMATDFVPVENTVQVNQEDGIIVTSLTNDEITKIKKQKNDVLAVEDDEWVTVSDLGVDENPFDQASGLDQLEFDDEAKEALEAEPFPGWNDKKDEPLMSVEQANMLSMQEPDVEEAINFENAIDGVVESTADDLQATGIPKGEIIKLLKCVIKCAVANAGSLENVTAEDIDLAMNAAGAGEGDVGVSARDAILRSLLLIFATRAWRYSTGRGARVAVLDTGIDPRHPDLRVYGGISYVPGVRSWADDHYHGTHVAGTIAALWNGRGIVGVAPHARLYAIKVLNKAGSGRTSWIVNGLLICARAKIHVANLSLGSGASNHRRDNYSRAFERAGQIFRRAGGLPVAASGNSNSYVGNPARCPSFMAVGAIDNRRRRAPFSNYGPQVEICAPGVSVVSTIPGGRYRALSGTSMATPHVAGVAALVKARRPTRSGDSIRVHLWRTALDLGVSGRDWAFGYGQVNAYSAARSA